MRAQAFWPKNVGSDVGFQTCTLWKMYPYNSGQLFCLYFCTYLTYSSCGGVFQQDRLVGELIWRWFPVWPNTSCHNNIPTGERRHLPNNQLSKITIVGWTIVRKQTSVRLQKTAFTFALKMHLLNCLNKCSWASLYSIFHYFLAQCWIITFNILAMFGDFAE